MNLPPAEKAVCRFAVISDTHLKLAQNEQRNIWSTHQLATQRTRFVVARLQEIKPDFAIHLGDMIHPVPGMPDYAATAEQFAGVFESLGCPLYTLPGNHDIGDKPGPTQPAQTVSSETVAAFEKQFGQGYGAFSYASCRFILINNPVFNSGLAYAEAQWSWLEQELRRESPERKFLFMHYPLYIAAPGEVGHYDNINEPARSRLLALLTEAEVEAAFAGHTHTFFYNRHGASDLYVIPSVTFVRQDYSELFRIGPAAEYGRNDTGKFGFFVVDVLERDHRVHLVRTGGATAETEQQSVPPLAAPGQLPRAPLGVELRHAWAEQVTIPYNYILNEFVRREARNDYPLLALWDIGIGEVRVPLGDLLDERLRERMQALEHHEQRFRVFAFGIPGERALTLLRRHRELVSALELVLPWAEAPELVESLQRVKQVSQVPLYLAPLQITKQFEHSFDQYIRHGFYPEQQAQVQIFLSRPRAAGAVDGFVFRLGERHNPWPHMLELATLGDAWDTNIAVVVQLASDSEAGAIVDDQLVAERVALAAAAAHVSDLPSAYLDTFCDIDRGYYVRHGLVDRRYNLRMGGSVLRQLARFLPATKLGYDRGRAAAQETSDGVWWHAGDAFYGLWLRPTVGKSRFAVSVPSTVERGEMRLRYLVTGATAAGSWSCIDDALVLEVDEAAAKAEPALLDLVLT